MKIVFIASTGGAVLNKLLEHNSVRQKTLCVISDRDCEAIEKAKKHNVPVKILNASSGAKFSKLLDEYFNYTCDIYFVLYSALLLNFFAEEICIQLPSFRSSSMQARMVLAIHSEVTAIYWMYSMKLMKN